MKLFFCDICNESIPLQDIKENKSTTIKGKIFCRKCNPLNELAATEPASGGAAKSGSPLLGLVAILLILVLGGLAYVIYDMKIVGSANGEHVASMESSLDTRVADLRTVVSALQTRIDALTELNAVPDQIARLEEAAASRAAAEARLTRDVAELQDGLVAVGGLRERAEALSLRQDESAEKLTRLIESVQSIANEVAEIRDRPPVIMTPSTPTSGDVAGTGDESSELGADLLAVVEKLGAADPMARWEAVDQIRRLRNKKLTAHVLPLLDDRDTFVKAQAIYTLGELKAMKAVPKLVKMLRDDEIMIREEALASLIVITGQNLKFDVTGSRSQRENGIKKWEEWLAKNKDSFEG